MDVALWLYLSTLATDAPKSHLCKWQHRPPGVVQRPEQLERNLPAYSILGPGTSARPPRSTPSRQMDLRDPPHQTRQKPQLDAQSNADARKEPWPGVPQPLTVQPHSSPPGARWPCFCSVGDRL